MPTKSVSLDTARSGIKLLSGLMKEAVDNKHITKTSLKSTISDNGLDADRVVAGALKKVHDYTCNRYDTDAPTMTQVNKALGEAMRNIAKADNRGNDNDMIDPSEFKKLATTWKSVMTFARDYEGYSVNDMLNMSHE